jgi:hypothetical protein
MLVRRGLRGRGGTESRGNDGRTDENSDTHIARSMIAERARIDPSSRTRRGVLK